MGRPTTPPASSRPPRVRLALPTGRDKAEYIRVREDSAAWLEPWEPLLPALAGGGGERSPIDDEAFERFHKSADTETSRRFLIRLIDQTKAGPIVGQVSINNIVRGPFLSATFGYWIAKPHAGQGLMAEALSLAITHAFSDLALHRVEANIIPRNSPSIALVKRLGFRYEGTATRYLRIAGQWEDHERWGLTVEDWPRPR
jgi:ribosomal-protein-alanine N-acetyltransferase